MERIWWKLVNLEIWEPFVDRWRDCGWIKILHEGYLPFRKTSASSRDELFINIPLEILPPLTYGILQRHIRVGVKVEPRPNTNRKSYAFGGGGGWVGLAELRKLEGNTHLKVVILEKTAFSQEFATFSRANLCSLSSSQFSIKIKNVMKGLSTRTSTLWIRSCARIVNFYREWKTYGGGGCKCNIYKHTDLSFVFF